MIRWLRQRFSYANVVASLALIVALSGTAWAAATIGSANVIDNSLQSRDIKNSSLTTVDINSATRSAFTDTSPWETLPSGRTITGEYFEDLSVSPGISETYSSSVMFPANAPVALTTADINFAPDAYAATSDDDATCIGTSAAPTAPPGKVCVYVVYLSGDTSAAYAAPAATLPTRGFEIAWIESGADSDVFLRATWAYTAP